MNQDGGAGHEIITRKAVAELYRTDAVDGRIDGLTESEYADLLVDAQREADRVPGPTIYPATWNVGIRGGDAQREHAMADPRHTGAENVAFDRDFVKDQLRDARLASHDSAPAPDAEGGTGSAAGFRPGDRDRLAELRHLGAAVHAEEDSYSEAHAWRDRTHPDDPAAPIRSINVWDPIPLPGNPGIFGREGTHDPQFDKVPVVGGDLVRAEDQAAVRAVAETLRAYEAHKNDPEETAGPVIGTVVDRHFATDGGPAVNREATAEWTAERDERLAAHRSEAEHAQLLHAQAHDTVVPGDVTARIADGGIGGVLLDPDPASGVLMTLSDANLSTIGGTEVDAGAGSTLGSDPASAESGPVTTVAEPGENASLQSTDLPATVPSVDPFLSAQRGPAQPPDTADPFTSTEDAMVDSDDPFAIPDDGAALCANPSAGGGVNQAATPVDSTASPGANGDGDSW